MFFAAAEAFAVLQKGDLKSLLNQWVVAISCGVSHAEMSTKK